MNKYTIYSRLMHVLHINTLIHKYAKKLYKFPYVEVNIFEEIEIKKKSVMMLSCDDIKK